MSKHSLNSFASAVLGSVHWKFHAMPEVGVISKFTNGIRRVESDWTVGELSSKFEVVTGIPPELQQIQFTSESGRVVEAPDKTAKLSSLGLQTGWQIRVFDTRPSDQQLDLSGEGVKYELPIEEYEKRPNTVLQWKKRNKLGRFSDPHASEQERPKQEMSASEKSSVSVALNEECFVNLVSGNSVRGVVAFIGEVPHIGAGTWIGVRLLSAEGRNDGTVKGVKLFDALPGHGVLVKPEAVRPLDENEQEL